MSEGDGFTPVSLPIRGPWSAALGDYVRRRRFVVAATGSILVLLPGLVGLPGGGDGPRTWCSVAGTTVLMVWTGLVSGHLKQVLARPQARLLPRYPGTQVLVGAGLVAPFAVLNGLFHWMAGLDALAAVALVLVVASLYWAGPYMLEQGHQLLFVGPPLLMVLGGPEVHPGRVWTGPGSATAWWAAGIVLGVVLLATVVGRMLHLSESSAEYDHDPSLGWKPGRPVDQDIPFSRTLSRFLPWLGRYRVVGLGSRFGASFPSRVGLWRRGMSRTSPVLTGLSLAGMMAVVGALLAVLPSSDPRSQAAVLGTYVMFFAVVRAAYLHRRKERLPREALYPATRARMAAELGGALAVDLAMTWAALWAGTVASRGLGLFADVSWATLLCYAAYSLGVTTLGGGLVPWLLRIKGHTTFLLLLYLGTLAPALPVALGLAKGAGLEAVRAWAAGGAVFAVFGALLGYAGYRDWCGFELGWMDP